MDFQDVQEVTNFFERRVSADQVGVSGEVILNADFENETLAAGSVRETRTIEMVFPEQTNHYGTC